jgi:plasma kallikrein
MLAILKREYLLDARVSADESMKIYQCGATLIAPNIALTAAHCMKDVDAEMLIVRAGEWDTQTPHEMYKHSDYDIQEIIIHDKFNPRNLHNDIALLVLSEPVKFSEHINTVCLPHEMEFTKDYECYAMGWGKDKFGREGEYQVILKRVQLPIVPHNECQNRLRTSRLSRYFKLHETFMCAGGEIGKDVCTG